MNHLLSSTYYLGSPKIQTFISFLLQFLFLLLLTFFGLDAYTTSLFDHFSFFFIILGMDHLCFYLWVTVPMFTLECSYNSLLVCTYNSLLVCTYIYLLVCTFNSLLVCTYNSLLVCTYIYLLVCTYNSLLVCTYVYLLVSTYIYLVVSVSLFQCVWLLSQKCFLLLWTKWSDSRPNESNFHLKKILQNEVVICAWQDELVGTFATTDPYLPLPTPTYPYLLIYQWSLT